MDANPEDLARAFGCPLGVARVLIARQTPMAKAIMCLGAIRVHWIGDTAPPRYPRESQTTPWSLDGTQATVSDLLRAAMRSRVK